MRHANAKPPLPRSRKTFGSTKTIATAGDDGWRSAKKLQRSLTIGDVRLVVEAFEPRRRGAYSPDRAEACLDRQGPNPLSDLRVERGEAIG